MFDDFTQSLQSYQACCLIRLMAPAQQQRHQYAEEAQSMQSQHLQDNERLCDFAHGPPAASPESSLSVMASRPQYHVWTQRRYQNTMKNANRHHSTCGSSEVQSGMVHSADTGALLSMQSLCCWYHAFTSSCCACFGDNTHAATGTCLEDGLDSL